VTLALREREPVRRRARRESYAIAFPGPGRGPMLDEVVSSAWAALTAGSPAACPLCDGSLLAQPDSAAARCRECGSELA
jgi:hypothetical protein